MTPQTSWSFDPSVVVLLIALSLAYGRGWLLARGPGVPHPPGYGRLALFVAGVVTVVAALESPLDILGTQLMVMHMLQHVLLLDIAPILFILSLTKGILRPITRRLTAVETRAGAFAHPAFAVLFYVFVMALWHLPTMYDVALRYENVHLIEHVCFGLAGGLYWWHLLSPIRSRLRLDGMGPVLYMVVTKLLVGVIGVILAFSPHSIYPFYQHHPDYWGLSPGVDQNLAGVVMALEQSIVMGIALAWLFVRMLGESEREAQRAERYEVGLGQT
jgi:cytochrome c oxidase assembly factor CtaG